MAESSRWLTVNMHAVAWWGDLEMPRTGELVGLFLAGLILCLDVFTTPANAQEHDLVRDRLAITDVVSQYAYRWDAKDADGFANLFTEDAVTEYRVDGELVTRNEGRLAIHNWAIQSYEGRLADRQSRHHMSALVFIELTEDSALTENMVLVTHQVSTDAAPEILGSGIYRNTWRRTDEGWKISQRVLFFDRLVE